LYGRSSTLTDKTIQDVGRCWLTRAYVPVYVTCYTNKNEVNEVLFEIDDGGNKFSKGSYFKTESIETLVTELLNRGVNNDVTKNPFAKLK